MEDWGRERWSERVVEAGEPSGILSLGFHGWIGYKSGREIGPGVLVRGGCDWLRLWLDVAHSWDKVIE